MNSVNLTFIISWFILIGFIAGLFILHKVSTVKQQFYGDSCPQPQPFYFCCSKWVIYLNGLPLFPPAAFVLFELALNAGPNLTTFVIPSLVFPLDIKAEGAVMPRFEN